MTFSALSLILWMLSGILQVALLIREKYVSPFGQYIAAQLLSDVVLLSVSMSRERYFVLYWSSALITTGLAYRAVWAEIEPLIPEGNRPRVLRTIVILLAAAGVLASASTPKLGIVLAVIQAVYVASALIGLIFVCVLAYLFLGLGVYPARQTVMVATGFCLYCSTFLISLAFALPLWTQQASWLLALSAWVSQGIAIAPSYTQENAVALKAVRVVS